MTDPVQLFRALADPTRLRILNLVAHREICVCQIVEALGLGQSKVSRHLAYLRNAGLVEDRRDGLWMYYSLAQPMGRLHEQVVEWLQQSKEELPTAANDLRALEALGKCGDMCPKPMQNTEGDHCDELAKDGSALESTAR